MKKNSGKIFYTVLILSALVAITVFIRSTKKTDKPKSAQGTKIKIAPEKQMVKPDDIIEEAIIGDDDQPIVGNGTVVV